MRGINIKPRRIKRHILGNAMNAFPVKALSLQPHNVVVLYRQYIHSDCISHALRLRQSYSAQDVTEARTLVGRCVR